MFDAPVREACTVRRDRTTSPLQSLAVLNDPLVVAAARGLARRMAGGAPAEVAARGFALATGRPPTADESAILLRLFWTQRHRFHCEPAAAQALLADSASTDPDAAAWVAVAGAILGLDEVITRS